MLRTVIRTCELEDFFELLNTHDKEYTLELISVMQKMTT